MNAADLVPDGTHRGCEGWGHPYVYGKLEEKRMQFGIRYSIDRVRVYGQTIQVKKNGEWVKVESKNLTYPQQRAKREEKKNESR